MNPKSYLDSIQNGLFNSIFDLIQEHSFFWERIVSPIGVFNKLIGIECFYLCNYKRPKMQT